MGKKLELQGKRFGRWTVLCESPERTKGGVVKWVCKCDCGNTKSVTGVALKRGESTSCGCYNHDVITKVNPKYKTKLYAVWNGIKDRCYNKNNKSYHNYGSRGIALCDEWKTFEAFQEWAYANDYQEGLWLERIDNNKGYSPENCKFTTAKEQQNNKRTNVSLTINGRTQSLTRWAEENGIGVETLKRRIELGWEQGEWFKPVDKRRSHPEAIRAALKLK